MIGSMTLPSLDLRHVVAAAANSDIFAISCCLSQPQLALLMAGAWLFQLSSHVWLLLQIGGACWNALPLEPIEGCVAF